MQPFASRTRARTGVSLIASVVCLAGAGCSREPTTPEAKRQRGDEIVRRMSDRLATPRPSPSRPPTPASGPGAGRITVHTTRQFTVRRPDRIAVNVTRRHGPARLVRRQQLTFVSDPQKVWARVNAAPTIDETLDRMADHLAMPMPMADFMYSSPYDSLIGTESTGGYVGRETVDGVACLHVAYQHPAVDWDLWVTEQGDPLPKKFRVTDKTSRPRGRRRSCSTNGRSAPRRRTRRLPQRCRPATSASRSWSASPTTGSAPSRRRRGSSPAVAYQATKGRDDSNFDNRKWTRSAIAAGLSAALAMQATAGVLAQARAARRGGSVKTEEGGAAVGKRGAAVKTDEGARPSPGTARP